MTPKKKNLLVVDDNPAICWLVADVFQSPEFCVFEARNGAEALMLLGAPGKEIDVILSDVVMPTVSGTELARIVLTHHPKIKIIFMSGQPDEVVAEHGVPQSRMRFLRKPFTAAALELAVRSELGQAA